MTLCLCWCTCSVCWPHFFCSTANGLTISLPSLCALLPLFVHVLFRYSYLYGRYEQLHVHEFVSMFLHPVLHREHRRLASAAMMDVHVFQELGQSRSELVVWILHNRARAGSVIFPDKIAVRIVCTGLYPVIMHIALHIFEGIRSTFVWKVTLSLLQRFDSLPLITEWSDKGVYLKIFENTGFSFP
jgi:hypothetical protein